jgi:hypothetical protein
MASAMCTAQVENGGFGLLNGLHALTKVPYKILSQSKHFD